MRRATRALLHASVHVAGAVGELGTSIPSNSKVLEDLVMYYGPEGLIVDCTFKGVRHSFAVPSANVKIVQLVPEAAPEKATPEKASKK